jgi:hypothetical protein
MMSDGGYLTKRKIAAITFFYLSGSSIVPVIALASAIIIIFPAQFWDKSKSCPEFYNIYLIVQLVLFVSILCFYFKNLTRWSKEKNDISFLFHSFLFNLYCVSNYLILHIILGTQNLCYGDGQSILAILPAGIISSLTTVPIFCIFHRLLSKSN